MKKHQHRHKARRARRLAQARAWYMSIRKSDAFKIFKRQRIRIHPASTFQMQDVEDNLRRVTLYGFNCAGRIVPHCTMTVLDEAHMLPLGRFTDELARRGGGPVREVD